MEVYEGRENFIFVSYAHKDASVVVPILEGLAKSGLRIWYDKGIEAGAEWPAYIEEHLRSSDRVLVFISSASVNSVNCRNEINFAAAKNKEMLVAYLEDVELVHGLGLQLSSKQSIFRTRHKDDASFIYELARARILQSCREGGDTANDAREQKSDGKTSTSGSAEGSTPTPSGVRTSRFRFEIGRVSPYDSKKGLNLLSGQVTGDTLSRLDYLDIFDADGELLEGELRPITIVKRGYPTADTIKPGEYVQIVLKVKHVDVLLAGGCYVLKCNMTERLKYMSRGLCSHCGGELKGLLTKKCVNCKKPKDY